MSRLHEMKVRHRNMSPDEKSNCDCELCKGLNVNKNSKIKKVEIPGMET